LAETTSAKTVFDEVLATAGKDVVTKDISRLRGGWPMQDAFYVSLLFFSNKYIPPCSIPTTIYFLITMIIMVVQKYSLEFVIVYDAWIWE
jgi:hypothetical protein